MHAPPPPPLLNTTMNTTTLLLLLSFMLTLLLPSPSTSQSCKPSCGPFPLHFPFGSGRGCGSPSFQLHITCNQDQQSLLFSTPSGIYPIQSIDYTNHLIFIQDPSMSNCISSCSSTGFSLDATAPFSFAEGSLFILLSCSSPLLNSSSTSLCDNSPICSMLSSCPSMLSSSSFSSSCCTYTPVSLGPAFQMNLKEMKCNGYAGVYSFSGDESNPQGWKYGIALKYRFSADDAYPIACDACEKSGGVCGFNVADSHQFACNCHGGMNTTTGCYFPTGPWSHALILSSSIWIGMLCSLSWSALTWMLP